MRFDDHQAAARATTRRLMLLFAVNVLLTVLGVNVLLALAWWCMTLGVWGSGFPHLFFETNTAMVLCFVLGGWWLESWQLRSGGAAYVARWLGGRELEAHVYGLRDQRLRNIVQEMAIASAMPVPKVFVLDREDLINAFAAGWDEQDTAIIVTKGALERLSRDELQGVVAHEFGHLQAGDTRLNMRLIGMVFGLQMVHTLGAGLWAVNAQGRRGAWALLGLALMGAGWVGWFAGRLLKAAVSRQREFLADAHAAQYTRYPHGLAAALRKLMTQEREGLHMQHPHTEYVSHVLFWSRPGRTWLATHPPLEERIRRLTGRILSPLPAEVLALSPDEIGACGSVVALVAAGRPKEAGAAAPTRQRQQPLAVAPPLPAAAVVQRIVVVPWLTPSQVRATVLAFFMPDQGTAHTTTPTHGAHWAHWTQCTEGVPEANDTLQRVLALSPSQKPIDFERILARAAELPLPYKTLTLAQIETLRVLGPPASGHHLEALTRWQLTQYRLQAPVAAPSAPPQRLAAVAEWVTVLDAALHTPEQPVAPERLSAALTQLRHLTPIDKAVLLKQWLQTVRITASQTPAQRQSQATALRWLCHLIDGPIPTPLEAFFEA